MVGYAVLMLLNQVLAATMGGMDGGTMDGGMGGPMSGSMAAGVDGGMVALAALMLFSGLVMTTRDERGM